MIIPPSLKQAKSYMEIQLSRTGSGHGPLPCHDGPFVTVSRKTGTDGNGLGCRIAAILNEHRQPEEVQWTVFDQNLVEEVLKDHALSPRLARFLPEARVSEVESTVGELLGLHPNLWGLIQQSNDFIRAIARRGHVIIVGRGANFATAGIGNGVHVRMVAPAEFRIARIAERLHILHAEAEAHVRKVDTERRNYVKAVFNADINDPTAYDMVVNIARITPVRLAALAAMLVHERTPTPAMASPG